MVRTGWVAVRTAVAMTVVALNTIVIGIAAVLVTKLRPDSRYVQRMILWWARTFLRLTGTRLELTGGEHVERGRSYVFVSNHASAIDIPVHFLSAQVPIRFLTKKELYRIPLLGFLLKGLAFVRVDRQAHAAGLPDVNRQVRRARDLGLSLMIYPEGTRTRTGDLAEFKKGAFRIAVDNGLPVVPMAVAGARAVWPRGSKLIWGGPVQAVVGPPIPTDDLGHDDVEELRDRARAWVVAALGEMEPA